MTSFIFFLGFMQIIFIHSAAGNLPADLFYVHYDQNYNVWRRIKKATTPNDFLSHEHYQRDGVGDVWMSAEDRKPHTIFLVELFSNPNELFAEQLDQKVLRRLQGPHARRLIPVFAKDIHRYAPLGTIVAETVAYKLLGRNSWYLAPTPEGYGGVFLKKIENIPLYRDKADRALLMVDYLESGRHLLPEDLQDLFVPEQVRSTVKTSVFSSDIFVFRSAEVFWSLDPKTRVFPLHGLLGTDLSGEVRNLKPIAQLSGISESAWKKKFLYPKLGRLTAYLHLVLGISLENHTQNLLAEVDITTGELKRLLLRDLGDGLMNPLVRVAWGDNLDGIRNSWGKTQFKNLAYHSWIEATKKELADIGLNTAVYTGQSLDSHGRSFRARLDANIDFIEHYLQTVNEITGTPVRLSKTSQTVLDSLKSANGVDDIYQFDNSPRGRIDSAVAFIVEDIYQQGLSQLLSTKIRPHGKRISFKDGKKRFLKAIADQRMAFSGGDTHNLVTPWLQTTWLGEKVTAVTPWLNQFAKVPTELQFFEDSGQLRVFDEQERLLAVEFIKTPTASLTPHTIQPIDFARGSSKRCADYFAK